MGLRLRGLQGDCALAIFIVEILFDCPAAVLIAAIGSTLRAENAQEIADCVLSTNSFP
jgi:hypothetical protein